MNSKDSSSSSSSGEKKRLFGRSLRQLPLSRHSRSFAFDLDSVWQLKCLWSVAKYRAFHHSLFSSHSEYGQLTSRWSSIICGLFRWSICQPANQPSIHPSNHMSHLSIQAILMSNDLHLCMRQTRNDKWFKYVLMYINMFIYVYNILEFSIYYCTCICSFR